MNTPFFSVIVPTYNRAHILSRSIGSVLSQTFEDFELIIVDNGSTDNTQGWLQENYQDKRIVYFYQEGSGTPASPRNTGISIAKGKWVCFLDSDDKWDKDKLYALFSTIKVDDAIDVICHNEYKYNEMDDSIGSMLKYGPATSNMYKDMLYFGNRLSTSATSIKAKFLKDKQLKFNESTDLSMVEDYDLWLNLARKGAYFVFLSTPLGFYTVGDSNMISNSALFCRNLRNLLKLHVFEIQQFSNNKSKLWGLLKLRVEVCEVRYFELHPIKKIGQLAKIFVKHPINFSIMVGGFFKRKLID